MHRSPFEHRIHNPAAEDGNGRHQQAGQNEQAVSRYASLISHGPPIVASTQGNPTFDHLTAGLPTRSAICKRETSEAPRSVSVRPVSTDVLPSFVGQFELEFSTNHLLVRE